MSGPFGEHAERLARSGYEPIPISLPSDGGHGAGKRPAIPGWQHGCPRDQWHRYAHCGLGILCRTTPALDIDTLDEEVSDRILAAAEQLISPGLPIRTGQPPRRLIPFRFAGEPFAKMRLDWRGFRDELHPGDKPPGVELLASGQQFVALGTHPGTRRPYTWHPDVDLDLPHGLLHPIDRATAEHFMRSVDAALCRVGAETHLTGVREERPQRAPSRRRDNEQPEVERVGDALERISADDYGTWVRVGLALKSSLPGPDGERLWHWWSARSAKYDQTEAERKWRSFSPGSGSRTDPISISTVFYLARGK